MRAVSFCYGRSDHASKIARVVNQVLVVGLIHMIVRCPKVIVSSLSVVQGGEEIRLTLLSRSAVLDADY